MLRGDIRYEQGCADEKPSNIAAGEEIVFGGSFLPGKVHADPEDDGEIDPDDDEIGSRKGSVSDLDTRCEQHPYLLGAAVVEPASAYRLKGTSTAFANWPWLRFLNVMALSRQPAPGKNPRKLVTAKSITGSSQAQCPFNASARFPRHVLLPRNKRVQRPVSKDAPA